MQISVTGRHVEITDAIRDYTYDRIADALQDFHRIESVHVILNLEKYRHEAEIVIQAKNHIRVDAKAESDDMYISIDTAVEKAERQMRKLKDKRQDHKHTTPIALVDLAQSVNNATSS